MPREIKFLSQNPHKLKEAQEILAVAGITVAPMLARIDELQTQDSDHLVRDKVLKAFDRIRRPVFVEHTGLYLASLNGLPGGLTQLFWDSLQADRFAELFGKAKDPRAMARTTLAYLDGRRIHVFQGEISGRIAENPCGSRDFQWDCVFVPDGHSRTFAELGDAKHELSMRRKALNAFVEHLEKEKRV
jgi:XTP/dITP diphosphohydrolase